MRKFLVAVVSISLMASSVHGQDEVRESSGVRVLPYTIVTKAPDGSYVDEHRLNVLLPGEIGAKPYEGLDISLGMDPVKGDPFDPNRVPFFENQQFLDRIMAVDTQVEELNNARQKFISSVTEMVQEALENGKGQIDDEAKAELVKKMAALRSEMESAASEVLLPHQVKLLNQERLLSRMKGGIVAALGSNDIRDELNLTDAQIEKMKALEKELHSAAKKLREEMEKQIADLKKKGEDKILTVLSSDQRSRLKELMGDR